MKGPTTWAGRRTTRSKRLVIGLLLFLFYDDDGRPGSHSTASIAEYAES